MIRVEQIETGEPMVFRVTVEQGGDSSRHRVSMQQDTYRRLTGGRVDPVSCVKAAFQFLLEREPKDSILPSFDVRAISLYFPRFEQEIPNYLPKDPGSPPR